MLTEDFILRQIAQAIAALVKVLGLSKAGQYRQAQQLIDQTLEEVIGLNASLIYAMDDRSLINLITTQGGSDTQRLAIIADLFKAEGDVFAGLSRRPESQASYSRALTLYLELTAQSASPPTSELMAKIDELRKKLGMTD